MVGNDRRDDLCYYPSTASLLGGHNVVVCSRINIMKYRTIAMVAMIGRNLHNLCDDCANWTVDTRYDRSRNDRADDRSTPATELVYR